MRRLIIVIILSVISIYANAQERIFGAGTNAPAIGKIKGTIIDKSSQLPIEFATLALFRVKDSSLVGGSVSDIKGHFLIEAIPPGRFFLKINFIGYKQTVIDSIFIRPNNAEVDLGTVKLSPNTEILKAVEVTADKSNMTIGIDRKIFNVEKSIVSEGGSANDVLQQVPSVDVDIDGNISLRGSGNVTILIDGKPSGLTGSSRQAILQQIPASSIESIEVITNPSAKYDPDGMGGIINIVMKKNKLSGFNGGIVAGAGTRDKYNASANINYRNKKINTYINYGFRFNNRFRNGNSTRKNILPDTSFYLSETSSSIANDISNNVKAGIEFYLNEKNTLGISALYNTNTDKDPEKKSFFERDINNQLTGAYSRINQENGKGNNMDYTIDYRKLFSKPKQELIFSSNYSIATNKGNSYFNEYDYLLSYQPLDATPLNQQIETTNKNNITTLQLDYTHPMKNDKKLETGAKSILRNINNDFFSESKDYTINDFLADTLLNNQFNYKEKIFAAYATYSGKIKNIGYQLGLRAEQTYTLSELITTAEKFKRNYFSLFPTIHLSKKFNKNQELQFSYSRRIDRPSTRELNPFKNYSDPYNIRYGNPYLKPEYTDSYELSYMKYFNKFLLSSTLYYRYTHDIIAHYKFLGDSTISYVTQVNLSSSTSAGLELIIKADLYKWWNITVSGNLFQNVINGNNIDATLQNENFSGTAKLISNMKVLKNLDIQLSVNYRGPWATAQGIMASTLVFDLGLKKEIFKNAFLSINITDITDDRRFEVKSSANTFEFDMYRKRESRIATITFSYSFGNLSEGGNKKGRNNRMNENNMNGGMDDMGM